MPTKKCGNTACRNQTQQLNIALRNVLNRGIVEGNLISMAISRLTIKVLKKETELTWT